MRQVPRFKERLDLKKLVLALLSGILIATIAGSTFTVFLLRPSSAAASVTTFEYRAKWVCNTFPFPTGANQIVDTHLAETIGLVPGEYRTDINVHNPSHSANITILEKFVVSVPPIPPVPLSGRPVTSFFQKLLFPDGAILIDCAAILILFPQLCAPITIISCAFKGFVVISQLSTSGTALGFTSDRLDVVGEYSSESLAPAGSVPSTGMCIPVSGFAPVPCVTTGISLDVERIPASPFVA